MHDFRKSLAFSHSAADLPIWADCYRQFFGGRLLHIVDLRHDGFHQRSGIDRALIMRNGKAFQIDEKYRSKPYNDIFLEYWSDLNAKKEGWIIKDSLCDYLAYAIGPQGVCYLFPMPQLQFLWEKNNVRWRKIYRELKVHNKGWISVGIAVPPQVIFGEMWGVMRASFEPINLDFFD